jgi:ABC-type dipeptide/oligopeptide/nickel transport system permease component
MLRLLGRKILEAIAVCLFVSALTFLLVNWTGNLAVSLAGAGSDADVRRISALYGLDHNVGVRYLQWTAHAARGDLGESFFSHERVAAMIRARLPVTGTLALASLLLGLLIAIPLGVGAAIRPGSWFDHLSTTIAGLAQAMPPFWTALLLILLFSVKLHWLPPSGTDSWRNFVMPTLALAWFVMPVLLRLTRAGMIEVLSADYIRTARAKGLPPLTVLFKHALRNAILPVVSVATVQFGLLLGGSIVIENVFALNGIGLMAWDAINRSDFPVLQGIVLIVALLFVLLNLAADMINALLDPKLRLQ